MSFSADSARISAMPGMRGLLPFVPFAVLAAANPLNPPAAYMAAAACCFYLLLPFETFGPGNHTAVFAWNRVNWRWAPILGLAIMLLGWIAQFTFIKAIGFSPAPQPLLREFAAMRGWRMALVFFTITVPVPLIEEWVFRHYLFGGLAKRIGWRMAAVATSLVFAAMHWYWPVIPGLFVMALAWQLVYLRSGSLGYAAVLHSCNNAMTLILLIIS